MVINNYFYLNTETVDINANNVKKCIYNYVLCICLYIIVSVPIFILLCGIIVVDNANGDTIQKAIMILIPITVTIIYLSVLCDCVF